jgi:pyruvate dehydrogenase E2 component (dihydrolipoamide acetyltransferase)
MPTQVLIPKVDNDATEGRISRWFVQEDAAVSKGDLLFEIETDKAAVEVEAPVAGRIGGIVAPQGGSVPVGSLVAWIWGEGESRGSVTLANAPVETPAAFLSASASSREPATWACENQRENVPVVNTSPIARLVPATPLARRLARERGIDLKLLRGTGPRGRIQSADIPDVAPNSRTDTEPHAPPVGNLHCEWLRTGEGEPIVLVHGFGSELAIWRPLVTNFALNAPILAIDLPGHGKSSAFDVGGFDEMVDLVEETLRAEGIRRAHLVGHSLGGATVAALAERSAVETRSLVLLSPAGLGPDINGAFLSGFCRARTEASLAPWMRLLAADPAQITPALVKATLRARSAAGAAERLERVSEKLFPDGTQGFSIRGAFSQLRIPVKVIFGTEDEIIPAGHARGLPGHVAIHCFADVGHMPHLEIRLEADRLLTEAVRAASNA